eukprot:7481757-Lingulodinium_polyedra.AAC.1
MPRPRSSRGPAGGLMKPPCERAPSWPPWQTPGRPRSRPDPTGHRYRPAGRRRCWTLAGRGPTSAWTSA